MSTQKKQSPAKKTAPRNWLQQVFQWAWWPVALLAVLVFVTGLLAIFEPGATLETVERLEGFDYFEAGLERAIAEVGFSPSTYLIFGLLPDFLVAITFVTIGLLIRLRRPDDWFSLFISLWMLVFGLVSTAVFIEPPQGGLLLTVYFVLVLLAYSGILVFLFTYPNGEFHPAWMRWVALVWGLFILSTIVSDWFLWDSVQSAFVIVPLLLAVLYSQVFRYRKVSTPAQREQTKWLLVAIALNVILIPLSSVFASASYNAPGTASAAVNILLSHASEMMGNLVLALAVGIAILRYRLWDIDVVVNRALIYGPLSLILAGLFAVSIVLFNQSSRQLFGVEDANTSAVLSALIVATVFTPLRTRIEGWINRKLYADSANLSRELVEISDPRFMLPVPALAAQVAERISGLVRADAGAVYLMNGRSFRLAAATKPRAKQPAVFTLGAKAQQELAAGKITNQGPAHLLVPLYVPRLRTKQLVGALALGMRKNGRGYSSDDRHALVELGGQVGTAIYAAQLRKKS
jgi:hypothetical protein